PRRVRGCAVEPAGPADRAVSSVRAKALAEAAVIPTAIGRRRERSRRGREVDDLPPSDRTTGAGGSPGVNRVDAPGDGCRSRAVRSDGTVREAAGWSGSDAGCPPRCPGGAIALAARPPRLAVGQ